MNKKRVGCLYRVSTLKQGEKDDIPMQKIACRDFIKSKQEDWILEKEYIELGVSGYKLSEKNRDVLQDIKKDVTNNVIDVLLVFMFDRIGRREEETPFVVEWLIDKGVEVWSVKEGQRKIETRADKLINYLTYWQAGGESEKTSIRVREAQIQMAEKGILTYGGVRNAPYGYKFIKSGTYTKKGVERQKLIINEDEKEHIIEIYNLYTFMNYGGNKIAKILNDKNIQPRRGKNWTASTIANILINPIYMGYPAYNKKTSVNSVSRKKVAFENWIISKIKIDDLAIIPENIWYKAKAIRDNRCNKQSTNSIPIQTKSKLLFIGLVRCGECGYAFETSESRKYTKDGDVRQYMYYRCSSHRFTNKCNLNKKSIKKELLEEAVLKAIYSLLDDYEQKDITDILQKNKKEKNEKEKKQLRICEQKIMDNQKKLSVLKEEVVKSITGNSNFAPELLNELIEENTQVLNNLFEEKSNIEKIIAQKNLDKVDIIKFKSIISTWKKEFQEADFELKKMLLSQIIKEIKVNNNNIEITTLFPLQGILFDDKITEVIEGDYKIVENMICLNR